jgi:diguanylate cyclase (GGDEF)-like protein
VWPRVELTHLRGRLARRLLVVFALCSIVPVALAGLIAYRHLLDLATDRQTEQLRDAAKSYGMTALAHLEVASARLEAFSQSLQGAPLPELKGLPRDSSFTSIRMFESGEDDGRRPDLPQLSNSQRRRLQDDGTVLVWQAPSAGAPSAFYLVRYTSDHEHLLFARLASEVLWFRDTGLARGSELAITDATGKALFDSRNAALLPIAATAGAPGAGVASAVVHWQQQGQHWHGVAWGLFLEGAFASPSLYIVPYESPAGFLAEFGDLQVAMPLVLVGALAFALLLATSQLRRLLKPLETLTNATRAIAARQLDVAVDIKTGDELAALGADFNNMATSLREQFTTLQTMTAVDRLLLQSPDLEQVLDVLLPSVCKVMCCQSVSVMLPDSDTADHARVYDYFGDESGPQPVRRVPAHCEQLERATEGRDWLCLGEVDKSLFGFARPLAGHTNGDVQLWPLRHGPELLGFLCLGMGSSGLPDGDAAANARRLADRLSVALTNLSHEQRLQRQAHFDSLTGLANRELFREHLSTHVAEAMKLGHTGALLYIDLDRFKHINDTLGHSAGDVLLTEVAGRLSACVRPGDLVARLGGDEFAVILKHINEAEEAGLIASALLRQLAEPFSIANAEQRTTASIGIALFPRDGETVETLLRNGDIAMYRAKDEDRGKAVYFAPEMHARMQARASIETSLRRAIEAGEMRLCYQPIYEGDRISGVEALVRWLQPSGVEMKPAQFIPIAEETGQVVAIGEFVLRQACMDYVTWRDRGRAPQHVSVNVAPRQLRQPDFVEGVFALLERHRMPPAALQLEITESVIVDGQEVEQKLRQLTAGGVRLALDDFGTGYSSLSHLHHYPFDVVKIDQSFVRELPASRVACRLVKTIIRMAHGLEKRVVAEGVESEAQLRFLRACGCDGVQGYFLGRPMPADAMELVLAGSGSAGVLLSQRA